jgi:hypothetical protein
MEIKDTIALAVQSQLAVMVTVPHVICVYMQSGRPSAETLERIII